MLRYPKKSGKNKVRYGLLHFIHQPSKLHVLNQFCDQRSLYYHLSFSRSRIISYFLMVSITALICIVIAIYVFVYSATVNDFLLFSFGNDSNIDGIGGFSEEETQSICKFMRVVIDMAVSGHKRVSIFR